MKARYVLLKLIRAQLLTSILLQTAGAREVDAAFPEALKGPILLKVQFQTLSRLDSLVDMVFDEFKADYYPGEEVMVTLEDGSRSHGLVRDKTSFGPRVLADGTRTMPGTRYLVSIKDSDVETMVTDENIARERGIFTKSMIRSFIKKTVMREAWTGAPWLVKNDYAIHYHIDTRIPPHLRYDTKVLERKQLQAQKREVNGHGPARVADIKPKGPKNRASLLNGEVKRESTPPPAIKYPIEDLQLEPRESKVRPALKYMCRNAPVANATEPPQGDRVDMDSVGALLETWDTLNVYCEVFKLDSFTFDDFVEAMTIASERVDVQLFDEVHCAVLKVLVDSEPDGGKVRIALPELDEDDSEDEDEEEDEEGEENEEDEGEDGGQEEEESPEPETRTRGRATRSSLAKVEAERIAAEAAAAEEESFTAEMESKRRAEELIKEYDWVDHLRRRDFPNGGWERIVVGLLFQLSKDEKRQALCEEFLAEIVPADEEPTPEAIKERYSELDVNIRIRILQLLCLLTMETKTVRGYMEDCNETMTKYRKERVEWQRQRKQATEELRQLHEQRKAMMPENQDEGADEDVKASVEVKMVDADETLTEKEEEEEAPESEDDAKSRQKKRRSRNVVDQRRKREEEEEARKAKEKADKEAAKVAAQNKQLNKVLKEIQKKEDIIKECEEEIGTIENDLREADCPRTRVLGKDRFWNRYYWFERNGMPYGGLPTSSTAEAGYANARIWIQGPDELEREGYIDVPSDLEAEYKAKFNMTIRERKHKEEGKTGVENARQWGYIADSESLDQLIDWLDPRGYNELRLRKELVAFRDKIALHMDNRIKYLNEDEEAEKEREQERETKRTSSRIREKTPEAPSYKCLRWENTMALDELGHLHADPPPPPRLRKQSRKREAMAMAEETTTTTTRSKRPTKARRK